MEEVEFKKVNKDIQIYPEEFKRKVVEEYLAGGCTKMDLLRKYGIKTKSGIQRWMKTLGYVSENSEVFRKPKFENVTFSCMPSKPASGNNEDLKLLQKRIAELERQLQDEKLRSEAYERIIEKAEKEMHIPIRKKPFSR
jgi:transposase-like protein